MLGKQYRLGEQIITWTQQKEGCLQLEFYERLKKLPAWDITHCYCASANLRDVKTGRPLAHFFNNRKQGGSQTFIGPGQKGENGIFRLGRYKIIIKKNRCGIMAEL